MGIIGKDFKFKKIENFITKDEISLLSTYCRMIHTNNIYNFDLAEQNNSNTGDTFLYGDPIMDSLLLKKQSVVEKECGKKILPTYSFWRDYTKFADLKKHKDRGSCEISVTLKIGGDDIDWPIFMDGTPINLKKGDAAVYLGREVLHWRDEYQGDGQFQCFLHYVDADGKYKDYHVDKRSNFGMKAGQ